MRTNASVQALACALSMALETLTRRIMIIALRKILIPGVGILLTIALAVFPLEESRADPIGPLPVTSNWDAGCDGWIGSNTMNCDETGTGTGYAWVQNGGNPDGFLGFSEPSVDGLAVAPAKFLGDWSALDGVGTIAYDHEVINAGSHDPSQLLNREIRISGPGGEAHWTGPLPCTDQNCSSSWETFFVPLNEAYWTVVSGSWPAILADVDDVRVRGEHYFSGNNLEGLDNFMLLAATQTFEIVSLSDGTLTDEMGQIVTVGDIFTAPPTLVFTPPTDASGTYLMEYELTQGTHVEEGTITFLVGDDNCLFNGRPPGCSPSSP